MIKGITQSGFNYQLDDDVRDDMELLEGFIELDNGEMKRLPKTMEILLGTEQKNALYDHCRGNSKRVSATKVFNELKEIMDNLEGDLKN